VAPKGRHEAGRFHRLDLGMELVCFNEPIDASLVAHADGDGGTLLADDGTGVVTHPGLLVGGEDLSAVVYKRPVVCKDAAVHGRKGTRIAIDSG